MATGSNVVEIIIRAVTSQANSNIKKTESGLDKLAKAARSVGQSLKTMAATGGLAAGILYGMARALDEVAKRGEALGQRGLTKEWKNLKAQGQELVDTILTLKIAGKNTFDLLERFAGGLAAGLKLVAVAVEMVAGGIDLLITDYKRLKSIIDGLTSGVDSYTQAMYEAERAQIILNHNQRIGLVWSEKLTESYEKLAMSQKGLRQSFTKTGESLVSLFNKTKNLHNEMSKLRSIQDAIRKGDPRAWADAQASGGSSGGFSRGNPGSGPLANRPGASSGGGIGNMSVQVFLGNDALDPHIERVVVNGIDRGHKKKRDNTANSRKGH